jgi:hypothetical protein
MSLEILEILEIPGGFQVDSKHNLLFLQYLNWFGASGWNSIWCIWLKLYLMHLVGTAIGAFGWNSLSGLYTPPLVLVRFYPVLEDSWRNRDNG